MRSRCRYVQDRETLEEHAHWSRGGLGPGIGWNNGMEWNGMGGLLLVFLRRLSLTFLVFLPPPP